ncbi:DNA-binding transcriptional regulator YhcF, GntR family [Anaerocolumna jejuensis DSM 15929]|uniref:DNA-binding transcriptional regulator YhcF, GntR family n=1 Tax=Anaerocolumna jejuensis DSM 15929 TaxID=1121322 RepID=A0A1M6R6W4_9FIRM|nr:DNA-binding transcriptional regulator YhcF, GntR family [Anaerocolumna jejuensis DSM 15929]
MIVTIDFNSDEAFYVQLCNQIIFGIANAEFREGDNLPSVRDLAEDIGINMHTVNKAYTILRQQGYVKLDRRKGAVIAVSADKYKAMEELAGEMRVLLAKAVCKNISSEEVHEIVDQIFCDFCSADREK